MDEDRLRKRMEEIRNDYWGKIHHYQAATDEGMPVADGDGHRRECLVEAYKAGAEIGLVPEAVAALLGDAQAL